MVKTLSIILPCYNEEDSIVPFLEASHKVENSFGDEISFDYIFIDDGSKDATLDVLRKLSRDNSKINYLSFSRNFGKEAAILAGLEHATGEYVTVMDVDLQDPPELLIPMYQKMKEGFDVVGTRRSDRSGEPIIRSLFAKLFYKLINLIGETEMVDGVRDFRLMTRQVVENILQLREVNRFSKGLFSWVGFKTTYVSYENRERVAGESSWSFIKLVKYSIDGFVNFSEAPLNLATWTGSLSFVASFLGMVFIVFRKLLFGDPVTGWASLVTIILGLGGLQLLSLGIIGKYLAKVFLETKARPIYIIKERGK